MKEIQFNGKVAVITGAASGMGLFTTKEFIRLGAKVIMCDVNEKALADAVAELGASAIPVAGDVRDYEYAEAVAAAIDLPAAAVDAPQALLRNIVPPAMRLSAEAA